MEKGSAVESRLFPRKRIPAGPNRGNGTGRPAAAKASPGRQGPVVVALYRCIWWISLYKER
ncbi:MAG: hypothetical protein P8L18_05040 [Verrucomicrobiota bacterium]|nr:hypothetical protein [Verrucomicrobiota bacterium]